MTKSHILLFVLGIVAFLWNGAGKILAQEEEIMRARPVIPAKPLEERREEKGELRIDDAGKDLFDYANMLFNRQSYRIASRKYATFLKEYPHSEYARAAHYRLAESYNKLGKKDRAMRQYITFLNRYQRGEFVDTLAYKVAELFYQRKEYKSALHYYALSAAETEEVPIRLGALFRQGQCALALKENKKAREVYEQLIAVEEGNPYYDSAALTIAHIYAHDGDDKKALNTFLHLGEKTRDQEIKGEAYIQAGLLYTKLKQEDRATALYKKVLALSGGEEWKAMAQYGLIKNYYRAEEYAKVINIYRNGVFKMRDAWRMEMFLMVGYSFEKLKKYADAIRVYNVLESFYGEKKEGIEAGYRKLLCFYHLKEKEITSFVDYYVKKITEIDENNAHIDLALLLKAETFFTKDQFLQAAESYQQIRLHKLPPQYYPSVLYKLAWSQGEVGDARNAVKTWGRFIAKFPKEERLANALAKRAENYRNLEEYASALKDLDRIIQSGPQSRAAEFAYHQSALIKGRQRDYKGMVLHFEKLLQFFPETEVAAEAHYWIGWGKFELKQYEEAIISLKKAREMEEKAYYEKGTRRIILAYYSLKKLEALDAEVEAFLAKRPQETVSPQVLTWLGLKFFEGREFKKAETYLSLVSDPEEPKQTRSFIWSYLGEARIEVGKYAEAIEALDCYLEVEEEPQKRGKTFFHKAQAFLKLKKYAKAWENAEEGHKLVRQGALNAKIWMLKGDIAMAQKQYREAAKNYGILSQTIVDSTLTPLALHKTALALEAAGDAQEASNYAKELQVKYPNFKPE